LPKHYSHTHDPFVALSLAAVATRTLKLAAGVALLPQRDPIITAKSAASLDHLSDGGFIFAVGGGWNVEEMENHRERILLKVLDANRDEVLRVLDRYAPLLQG
jgi:alkanesulfonate monooxygenase SsuD/methylene tetrahydromethanopterin reductase-like flavin-dependent oxidoreductase (luciferase family)